MLTKMSLSNADYDEIMIYDGSIHDKACAWILNHTDTWSEWVPDDPDCVWDDVRWTVSHCNKVTNRRSITYIWNEPKSCANGIQLPSKDHLSCDAIEPYSTMGFIMLTALILLTAALLYANVQMHLYKRQTIPFRLNIPIVSLDCASMANIFSIVYLSFFVRTENSTSFVSFFF